MMAQVLSEEAIEQCGPKFDPPLYQQRYTTVKDILYKIPGIEKVADLGCAEGKFIKYLKNLPFVSEIACVDLHKPSLYMASRFARPLAWDFVFKRYKDLYIKLFHGSACEMDSRLEEFDAVTCIELIEHLHLEDLPHLVSNVFGFIKPKVAIFTTPNQEFNVLFPQVKEFRHWDHKFEWTRQQLLEWCQEVVDQYPNYSYEIRGVGDPPAESFGLGHCSQLALFQMESDSTKATVFSQEPYDLLEKHHYPGRNENTS